MKLVDMQSVEALCKESDRLFNTHQDATPSLEMYHREAQNLTLKKELYYISIWQEYEG